MNNQSTLVAAAIISCLLAPSSLSQGTPVPPPGAPAPASKPVAPKPPLPKKPAANPNIKNKVGGVWSWKDVPKYEQYNDYPSQDNKWSEGSKSKQRRELKAFISKLRTEKPDKIKAFPSAEDFPGIPEDGAAIIEKTVEIDPQVAGWQSTGLYALPGIPVSVKLSTRARLRGGDGNKYTVRIGCHTDVLNIEKHTTWERTPELSYAKRAKTYRVEIASPSGGLIYICQNGAEDKGKPFPVEISGAVEAPHYIYGKTTPEEWKQQLENSTAPWGEIDCPRLVSSIRTIDLRDIHDIEKTAEVLQKSLEAQDWLIGWDKVPGSLKQPMRFVADRQITVGAGHSGYPAMGGISWGRRIGDGSILSGHWGLWHETGHNHQTAPWRMDGMGEVTVNLFTLVSHCKALGQTIEDWHFYYSGRYKIGEFLTSGKKFYDTNDAFTQLYFFAELIHGLGFEPFREASLRYHRHPYDNSSTSNQSKWEWLAIALGEASGKNLVPYFEKWGFELSNRAKNKLNKFPVWLPAPDYPKNMLTSTESSRTRVGPTDPEAKAATDDYTAWLAERMKEAEANDAEAQRKAAEQAATPAAPKAPSAEELESSTDGPYDPSKYAIDDTVDDEAE